MVQRRHYDDCVVYCVHGTVCLVECPTSSGFTYMSNSGLKTCFKLVPQNADWLLASSTCLQHQAHLVVINDARKQLAVKNFVEGEDMTSYREYLIIIIIIIMSLI